MYSWTIFESTSIVNIEDHLHYPLENLNTLHPPRFPLHKLQGPTVILLRNISPHKLCNGPRIVIKNIYKYVIEETIITGNYKNTDVFIPKIS